MKSHGVGFLFFIATVLSILAFPSNPLVILKVIESGDNEFLQYVGWVCWTLGIILVILSYYYIYYRKVETLLDSGIYAIVRHPLYLGWISGIFVATVLLYQHRVFLAVGIPGTASVYLIAGQEEQSNIEKFGDDYRRYMHQVPRMNLVVGFIRLLQRRRRG